MDESNLLIAIEERLDRISVQVGRLRKAVEAGQYNPREIAGDVTLAIEGELRQTRKLLEENKPPHQ